jgi:hypothetical protein
VQVFSDILQGESAKDEIVKEWAVQQPMAFEFSLPS